MMYAGSYRITKILVIPNLIKNKTHHGDGTKEIYNVVSYQNYNFIMLPLVCLMHSTWGQNSG